MAAKTGFLPIFIEHCHLFLRFSLKNRPGSVDCVKIVFQGVVLSQFSKAVNSGDFCLAHLLTKRWKQFEEIRAMRKFVKFV